ncbi:MAG TPA: hypothetical protein VEZ72_07725, partial [Paenibacillus sp.]|nr:hypothetical protein [Paenibacillus sp.]
AAAAGCGTFRYVESEAYMRSTAASDGPIALGSCTNCTALVQKVLHGSAIGDERAGDGGERRANCTGIVHKLHRFGA